MPATIHGSSSPSTTLRLALVASIAIGAMAASRAEAQTWSSPRGRPALWQISSVDATGDSNWPYGAEDVAGDGASTFEDDEAGADLRTVYADADADRLWLRAYVAAEGVPSESTVAYFFLDTDARNTTGGAASSELWPELEADPTPGGYERVIAASGDGMLVGAFRWDEATDAWQALEVERDAIRVEVEVGIDPIRIGADERGYFQMAVDHAVSTLSSSCGGNVLVRIRHEDPPDRTFGDDDDEAWACRSPLDGLGDPVVLREAECTDNADCPAGGFCVNEVCLFTYECTVAGDCPDGEQCTSGRCVRVVEEECTADAMCDGLVCANGSCAACTESGARTCEGDLACSPDGSCVDTNDVTAGAGGASGAGAGGGGAAGAAGAMTPPGEVRGGAFHCAVSRAGRRAHVIAGWSLLVGVVAMWRARKRRASEEARS